MNNFVFGDARASCKGLAPKGGYAEVPRVCPAVLFKAQRSLNRTAGDEPTEPQDLTGQRSLVSRAAVPDNTSSLPHV